MRDVEWTNSSVPLPDPQPKGREHELWHIGKAGQEIFLQDYSNERSYVIYKGTDFAYGCNLQVVRYGDEDMNQYKLFFVGFSQED